MKHSSSFTYDLSIGEIGEDWVLDLFNGKQLIEVKTDRLAHKTGNIFIEYECRNKPSGLSTTTANYWIYRIDEIDSAIIVPVDRLKKVCRLLFVEKRYLINGGDENKSKGFLIPLKEFIELIRKS
jgi:hypothetical protein